MHRFDLAIRTGTLLPMNAAAVRAPSSTDEAFVLRDQLIGVKDSKIVFVGQWTSEGWSSQEFINAQNKIVMPGLVNGHCHLPMTLFRGLADDLCFDDWLNNYILPLEARLVSPEFVTLGSELAVLEAFTSGTTTIYDMYYFEDQIADVVERSGIRALVGETVFDFVAPDNKKQDGSEYLILDRMVERWNKHERVTPFVAPHAPYSCGDETLKKARDYAHKKSLAIGIHVSETRGEVEGSLMQYGKTPLKRLHDLGVLSVPTIVAHGVHLTDEEIALAAKNKTSVIYNPESNMKLGAGAAPIPKLLQAGVTVGLGTDGPASNNDLNLFKEMDIGAKLQKLMASNNMAMTAKMALEMATCNGAKALGLGDKTGSIEVGKCADLIVIDPNVAHMQPQHDVASLLVYAAKGSEVETVVCHGKVVVRNRQCTTIHAGDLFGRINEYRSRMKF